MSNIASDLLKITGSKIAGSAHSQMFGFRQELAERLGVDDIKKFSKMRFLGNQIGKTGLRAVGLNEMAGRVNLGDLFSSYRAELKSLKAQRQTQTENEQNGVGALEAALSRIEGIDASQHEELLKVINSKFSSLEDAIKPPDLPELKNTGKSFEATQLEKHEETKEELIKVNKSIAQSSQVSEINDHKITLIEDKSLSESRKQTDILERILSQMSSRDPVELDKPGSQSAADSLFDFGLGRRGKGGSPKGKPKFGKLGRFGRGLLRGARVIPGVGLAIAGGLAAKDAFDGFSDENATKLFGKSNLLTKSGAAASSAISGLTFGLLSPEKAASTIKFLTAPVTALYKIVTGVSDKVSGVFSKIGDGFSSMFDWLGELPVVGGFFSSIKSGVSKTANLAGSIQNSIFSAQSNMLNMLGNKLGLGNVVDSKIGGTSLTSNTGKATPVGKDVSKTRMDVFNAFKTAGFSENQAIALTAEVGRENGFNKNTMFGTHTDPAKDANGNNITNYGMFSWNKGRGDKFLAHMKARGFVDKNGKMIQSQEALVAQAEFARMEMNSDYSGKMKHFMNNPNADPETFAQEVGRNYVGWARGQDTIKGKNGRVPFNWRKQDQVRANHKAGLQADLSKSRNVTVTDKGQTYNVPSTIAKPQASAVKEKVPAVKAKSKDAVTKALTPEFRPSVNMGLPGLPNANVTAQANSSFLPINTDDKIDDLGLHMFIKGVMA